MPAPTSASSSSKAAGCATSNCPASAPLSGFGGERGDTETFYAYSSFAVPASIYRYDLINGKSELWKQPTVRVRAVGLRDTDETVFAALRVIDANKMGIAFVLDDRAGRGRRDRRRHPSRVRPRARPAQTTSAQAMTRTFVYGEAGMSPAELRARLPGRTRVMPILDADGHLVDFASLDTLGSVTRVT